MRTQAPPLPRYEVTPADDGGHHVVDRRHGYALTRHPTASEAGQFARVLASSRTVAVAAVRALDAAQTGPAADVRRTLRRYGYRWALAENGARARHREGHLTELVESGHLSRVWSSVGHPFYCTPERFTELSATWRTYEGGRYPTAPLSELERDRLALGGLPERKRYAPCDLHGITLWACLLCGPRESWECQWGECVANAVTSECERCGLSPVRVGAGPVLPSAAA
ncbi:hypothetical protein [Streptomyces sp. NPDC058595]|uniref:hypothetical protein n=1 Tax=Streptomyces sp. NPDC058595 TaxID=3346550 RepID=UPI00365A11C9